MPLIQVLIDLAWIIAACTVGLVGAAVILHALLADAVAGAAIARRGPRRLRCPGGWRWLGRVVPVRAGCWYDLSGAPQDGDGRRLCPECGRASGPRRMRTARRRWGRAATGALILLLGFSAAYGQQVYRRGWRVVPEAVLVRVPFDERVWVESRIMQAGGLARSAAEEIDRRLAADAVSTRGLSHLGRRMVARYARDPDHGVDDPSREAFERMESIPFTEGLERVPLRHAVARIAAAAGVPLELDESGLLAASIDPGRVISIPAYTLTCEQALDMVCGRSFATSGWAQVGWDVREGALVIGARASLEMHVRSLAIEFPWNDTAAPPSRYPRFVSVSATWPESMLDFRPQLHRWGGGMAIIATNKDLLRVQRLVRTIAAAEGMPTDHRDAVSALAERVERARITGIAGDETLDVMIHRLRTEAGLPVVVDSWGLDLHIAYRDTLSRSPLRRSMTAADPFSRGSEAEHDPRFADTIIPEVPLWLHSIPLIHDEQALLVGGIRVWMHASSVRAYPIPHPNVEFYAANAAINRRPSIPAEGDALAPAASVLMVFDPRTGAGGPRLVVRGTPDVQERAAEYVDQLWARHKP